MTKYVHESEDGREGRIMPGSAWDAERHIALDQA
jgi:hypothetical protein